MATPLQKARKDPGSAKGKILKGARRVFGEYGFHGATTRLIAQEAGMDVSALYYHWGEKADLYEAVVMDINNDLRMKLIEVEKLIHDLPLAERIAISLDIMTDYFFRYPEITNVILARYVAKIRNQESQDLDVPMYISNIGRSMGLETNGGRISIRSKMQVMAIMHTIYIFVSGAESFRANLGVELDEYIQLTKETLKFMLIAPFEKDPISKQMQGAKYSKIGLKADKLTK